MMVMIICTTMMLPMMFSTVAVVLLRLSLNCTERAVLNIYFPLRMFCGNISHLAVRAAPFSERNGVSNLTRTVHVHVSSKDAHVLAVAVRRWRCICGKEKLRFFTLAVTQLPRRTIQSTTWLKNGNVKNLGTTKLLKRRGLKHLGSGHQ